MMGRISRLNLTGASGGAAAPERLGTVHFATSCRAEVQPAFDRAVALLHSFWFSEARAAFTGVLEKDPECAIAYWGISLSHLGNPFGVNRSQQALASGHEAAAKGLAANPKTERERGYLSAVALLFTDADTKDQRWITIVGVSGTIIDDWFNRRHGPMFYMPMPQRPTFAVNLVARSEGNVTALASVISTEDGTGLVHLAPAFGVEDMETGRAHGLPVVNPVLPDGRFEDSVPLVGGMFFKTADALLIKDLADRGPHDRRHRVGGDRLQLREDGVQVVRRMLAVDQQPVHARPGADLGDDRAARRDPHAGDRPLAGQRGPPPRGGLAQRKRHVTAPRSPKSA